MLKILHNPRCSKSRQTLNLITEKNIDVQVIEYLKDNPTKEELSSILKKLNAKPQEILRKGEAIFKENFKGKDFTDDEWLEVLVENPKLIERPIVFNEKTAVIGRPPENINKLL